MKQSRRDPQMSLRAKGEANSEQAPQSQGGFIEGKKEPGPGAKGIVIARSEAAARQSRGKLGLRFLAYAQSKLRNLSPKRAA